MARRSRRVPVISFDTLVAMEMTTRPSGQGKIAVFLDEAFVDHPDFEILGVKSPASYDSYWPAMERLFRAIEERTNLRVIIAPHPKSSGVAPAEIKARMAEVGRTADLVRQASLVVCHSSTAVAYAVLFKRPLLFATTDEIERSWYYRGSIARMSSCFRVRRVNADRFDARQIAMPTVNEALYCRYENSYLRAPNARLAPPWAVLRDEMEAHAGRGRADIDSSAAARAHARQGVA
jgi:hypothetical protein